MTVALDPATRRRLRTRSKQVYGNADRLEVAFAVARSPGVVHAQELSTELDISPPRVRAQLLAFTAAGLMRLLPRDRNVQSYERIEHVFWDTIVDVVRGWTATDG